MIQANMPSLSHGQTGTTEPGTFNETRRLRCFACLILSSRAGRDGNYQAVISGLRLLLAAAFNPGMNPQHQLLCNDHGGSRSNQSGI